MRINNCLALRDDFLLIVQLARAVQIAHQREARIGESAGHLLHNPLAERLASQRRVEVRIDVTCEDLDSCVELIDRMAVLERVRVQLLLQRLHFVAADLRQLLVAQRADLVVHRETVIDSVIRVHRA